MSLLAWLIYFWFMPVFAVVTLYFKLLFAAVFGLAEIVFKIVRLIMKLTKTCIMYVIKKIKEHGHNEHV